MTASARRRRLATKSQRRKDDPRPRLAPWLLMWPTLAILLVFFVGPLVILLVYSSYRYVPGGTMEETFTLQNYRNFLTDPFNLGVLWNTVKLGLIVTIVDVVLGLPVAYSLARMHNGAARAVLYALLLVPLMSSVVVRSYGWMVLLAPQGLVNESLLILGVIKEPLTLLYRPIGTAIALSAVLLPFMVIILTPVIQAVDQDLELAAQSLGAANLRSFFDVVLPIIRPGLGAGSIVVFVLAIGSFATPALVGGVSVLVMPLYIYQQALGQVINWPFASAMSFVLLLMVLLMVVIQSKLLERNRRWRDDD
jgi:putative spermidine/putrescine transport system permease protein